ncbi:MAG TPA: choice-of-anchor V domain-containing protein [Blastocatellia bacterium]|nr:choice-of-anchor V domain-containing protein [Blastocatellia bacterium]
MRIHRLKLTIALSLGILFTIYSFYGSSVRAFSSGPPPGNTGAPGEATCTSCHFQGAPGGGSVSISGLPATYSPNQEITLTVTVSQPNRQRYGFSLTALDSSNNRAGDLLTNNDNRTLVQSVGRQYISHTFSSVDPTGPGLGSWTFKWKAPAQTVGRVTFYVAGNAANGDFQQTGDTIYTSSRSVEPGAPPLGALATVSAASFAPPSNALSANQIVAGFGTGLAQNTTFPAPGSTTLPTVLDGTSIAVRDANGTARDAGLFFVSSQQVNYLIPPDTVIGPATITLRRNGVDFAQGTVNIETVAPGIFTANSSGSGLPAAVLFRRRGTVDTFESISPEIDLGPEGPNPDVVFLIAFGTGISGLSSLMGASATIGGINAPIGNVVSAPGFFGLQQINIFIPPSLRGRGLVNVIFTADNKQANMVEIRIK